MIPRPVWPRHAWLLPHGDIEGGSSVSVGCWGRLKGSYRGPWGFGWLVGVFSHGRVAIIPVGITLVGFRNVSWLCWGVIRSPLYENPPAHLTSWKHASFSQQRTPYMTGKLTQTLIPSPRHNTLSYQLRIGPLRGATLSGNKPGPQGVTTCHLRLG